MDLIGLIKRFGPQTVVGASINLVIISAALIAAIVNTSERSLPTLIGLEIAFIGMLVFAIFLRRANLFQPERLPFPLDDLPEGHWRTLPPLGEPPDEVFTRWHAVNATIAFMTHELDPQGAQAWADEVLALEIPIDSADLDILDEFLVSWSSDQTYAIDRDTVEVWQSRLAWEEQF